MIQSESIKELATALAKAQAKFKPAKKTSVNPYFKSNYADLAEVREAAREGLAENGLSVTQVPGMENGMTVLYTQLMHSSGEYIRGVYPLTVQNENPQALGSALTYGKRYGFCAVVGITTDDEDDDGNGATQGFSDTPTPRLANSPVPHHASPAQHDESNAGESHASAEFRLMVAQAHVMAGLSDFERKFINEQHERIAKYGADIRVSDKQMSLVKRILNEKSGKGMAPQPSYQDGPPPGHPAALDDEIPF